jgi:hypothetical protein
VHAKGGAGGQPVLLARDRDKLELRTDDADGAERLLGSDELDVRGPYCCQLSYTSIAARLTRWSALSSAKYGSFASLNVRIYHALCQSGNKEVRIE